MAGTRIFPRIYYCFVTKTKCPVAPLGLVFFLLSFRGFHPPLYSVGLSGRTLTYRNFKRTCSGKARLATTLLKAAEGQI